MSSFAISQPSNSNAQQGDRATLRRNAKLTCTHGRMGIIHVISRSQICPICRRIPRTGTLYYCQEEDLNDHLQSRPKQESSSAEPFNIQEMIDLGMSASVIKQARQGLYTPAQIDKLKNQRKNVITVIAQTMQQFPEAPSTPGSTKLTKTVSIDGDSPFKPGDGTPATTGALARHQWSQKTALATSTRMLHERCTFQCCQVSS